MRKLLLTVALASAVAFANAQTMTSKNGTPILPEVGEFWLGFDAVPVLNYFGNVFNNTANNSVQMSYQTPMTIVGGYVVDENTSYRGKLRIGFGSNSVKNAVSDDASTTAGAQVLDERTNSNMGITLGAGIQKNRGKGRLRGIYGAEVTISFGSGSTTNDYANAYSTTNQAPTSTDFSQIDPFTGDYLVTSAASRVTETKNGSTFGLGLRAFGGVEYFFAPKMSLSAEYGWGLAMNSTGDGTTTTEYWDGSTPPGSVKTQDSTSGGDSSFGLDVDNAGGSINLAFYF